MMFAYRLVPGVTKSSKALRVARKAGIPHKVLERAHLAMKGIAAIYKQAELNVRARDLAAQQAALQAQPPPGNAVSSRVVSNGPKGNAVVPPAKRPRDAGDRQGSDQTPTN